MFLYTLSWSRLAGICRCHYREASSILDMTHDFVGQATIGIKGYSGSGETPPTGSHSPVVCCTPARLRRDESGGIDHPRPTVTGLVGKLRMG